jgi:hypothetical protein
LDFDKSNHNAIQNPAGFVRSFVEKGWTLPEHVQQRFLRRAPVRESAQLPGASISDPEQNELIAAIDTQKVDSYLKSLSPQEVLQLNEETFEAAGLGRAGSGDLKPENFDVNCRAKSQDNYQHTMLRMVQRQLIAEKLLKQETLSTTAPISPESHE